MGIGAVDESIIDEVGFTASNRYAVTNIDKENPTIIVTISPTTFTTKPITVTAKFADNKALTKKQYKNSIATKWSTYSKALSISKNCTILFRAEDKAGNYFIEDAVIDKYVSENIKFDSFRSSTAEFTNGNVTVSALFKLPLSTIPLNNINAYYRLNGGSRKFLSTKTKIDDYTFAISNELSANGYISFEVGFASSLKFGFSNVITDPYSVTNIYRISPVISFVKSTELWTNQNISAVCKTYLENPLVGIRTYEIIYPTNNDVHWAAKDSINGSGIIEFETNTIAKIGVTDNAGNEATAEISAFNIDKIAPTISDIYLNYYPNMSDPDYALLCATFSDEGSGIKYREYVNKTNRSRRSLSKNSVQIKFEKNCIVDLIVCDNAGNKTIETRSINELNIDEEEEPLNSFGVVSFKMFNTENSIQTEYLKLDPVVNNNSLNDGSNNSQNNNYVFGRNLKSSNNVESTKVYENLTYWILRTSDGFEIVALPVGDEMTDEAFSGPFESEMSAKNFIRQFEKILNDDEI